MIEKYVFRRFPKNLDFIKAAHYNILPSGHRYRSLLSLQVYETLGGRNMDFMKCIVGIECFHSSTLIFDDLPSMDNSPLRKGKIATHIKFGQATAILAALFLENIGKQLICEAIENHNISKQSACNILKETNETVLNLIIGQQLDLKNSRNQKELETVLCKKNQLFYLACVLPVLFVGKNEYLEMFSKIGNKISVAYQLFDDLRDIESTQQITGKLVGVDKEKNTSVYRYGADKVKDRLQKLEKEIV
jgi:geranylgeranyl pyrophosphate synthase